jgi:peptide-methionine (S)-S-oxide reductase
MQRILRHLFAPAIVAASLLMPLPAGASSPNSAFPKPALDNPIASARSKEVAVLSGGCFWGVQAVFQHTRGVISATSGYTGGKAETARYDTVETGKTGHAESVQVVFDPSQITYGQILMIFFAVVHNPTELNKQGPDWGTQYRSALFYSSPEQKKIAEAYIRQLDEAKIYPQKIVTAVAPLQNFYPAEKNHQDYVKLHPDSPYIVINDLPKLANLRKRFPDLYREN